jgi:uncharacterized protein YdhG (YjbR/CyaY superfamily)
VNQEIETYNSRQDLADKEICDLLAKTINNQLLEAESKIWHAHPVWFLDGNPIVGYCKRKQCVSLLFWSGEAFEEELLKKVGKFKAAEFCYTSKEQIDPATLKKWLKKSVEIQWDYKNIVKNKGQLEKLK